MRKQQRKSLEDNAIGQRITEGAILEIEIENQYYVYAQILKKGLGYAFFNNKFVRKLNDYEVLNKTPILFIIMVYDDVVLKGKWVKVAKLPIREELLNLPMQFIQDKHNPQNFELYNPNTGEISIAKKEQCIGLESAAVWAQNHVEERIRDYYLGVPNAWLEQLKVK